MRPRVALVGRQGHDRTIGSLQLDKMRIRTYFDLVGSAVDKTADRHTIGRLAIRHLITVVVRVRGKINRVSRRGIGKRGAFGSASHGHVNFVRDEVLRFGCVKRDGLILGERVGPLERTAVCDLRCYELYSGGLGSGGLCLRGGELDRRVIDDTDVIHLAVD